MEDFGSNKENLQRSGARTVVKTYQINRASVDSLNGQEKNVFPASEQAENRGRILTESHHQNGATDKNERKCKDYGDWLQQKKMNETPYCCVFFFQKDTTSIS